jgi:16S rRNA (guanine966-N2)-methyltransferase
MQPQIMRITGGIARGVPLRSPKGLETRPATDQIRAAVFSSLMHSGIIENASVLDLFAGTGAYGLEALSRQAASVCFVEKNAAAITALKHNVSAVEKSIADEAVAVEVLMSDVMSCTFQKNTFDLIFADPPYALWKDATWLNFFCTTVPQWLKRDKWIVVEIPGELSNQEFLGLKSLRTFGKVRVKGAPSIIVFQLEDNS